MTAHPAGRGAPVPGRPAVAGSRRANPTPAPSPLSPLHGGPGNSAAPVNKESTRGLGKVAAGPDPARDSDTAIWALQ